MDNSNDNKDYVASQQNLFFSNLNNNKNDISKDAENKDNKQESDPFFMQFDFFNQNMKVVKSSNDNKQDKVQMYENKFESLNNLDNEIEPSHAVDISNLKSMQKITRDKPIKETKKIQVTSTLIENIKSPTQEAYEKNDNEKIKSNSSVNSNNLVKEEKPLNSLDNNKASKLENVEKIENADENDYKLTIGKLYSDSKHEDPYEANKLKSFKQIFPKAQITPPHENTKVSHLDEMIATSKNSNIDCDDIKMLNNLYHLQGIKIKSHNSISKKQSNKMYTDKNKLNMYTMLLTSFIMLCEIIISYIIIRNSNKLVFSHTIVFFLTGALAISFAVISILENFFDRYKLIIIKDNFKKELTTRLLIFIIFSVVVFAICLAFGMKSLGDKHFIALWLIPVLLSSNVVVYYLIKYFFIKQKYFNS